MLLIFRMLLGRMLTCGCRVSCEGIAVWACQTHSLKTPGSRASSINASTLSAWQMTQQAYCLTYQLCFMANLQVWYNIIASVRAPSHLEPMLA